MESLARVGSDEEKPAEKEAPLTFHERIKLWRGAETEEPLLNIIFRPIPLSILPPVVFSFITGLSSSWFSVLLGVSAFIYGSAPYNLSVSQLGLLFIGGVPVSILGFIAGPMNDWTCKFMARRNRGIYEPEVRHPHYSDLLTLVPSHNDDLDVRFLRGWIFRHGDFLANANALVHSVHV